MTDATQQDKGDQSGPTTWDQLQAESPDAWQELLPAGRSQLGADGCAVGGGGGGLGDC